MEIIRKIWELIGLPGQLGGVAFVITVLAVYCATIFLGVPSSLNLIVGTAFLVGALLALAAALYRLMRRT